MRYPPVPEPLQGKPHFIIHGPGDPYIFIDVEKLIDAGFAYSVPETEDKPKAKWWKRALKGDMG